MCYSDENGSACLSEEDVKLFNPICRQLNMPVQPPVSVLFLKKISVIDNPTGRMVEYRSSNESSTSRSFNVVSVTLSSKATAPQFGIIKGLFVYRDVNFAVIEIFECPIHFSDGIVDVTNCTNTSRAILPLVEVSRPLIIAMEKFPQLYIINS